MEEIQDFVEQALMEANHYKALKSYILYREERARKRKSRKKLADKIPAFDRLALVLAEIQKEFTQEEYDLEHLYAKFQAFGKPELNDQEKLSMLIKAAVELTTQEANEWEMVAARLLMLDFESKTRKRIHRRCHIEYLL